MEGRFQGQANAAGACVIAVDIGGTQIRAALCDRACAIRMRASDLTADDQGTAAIMERVERSIRTVWPPEGTPCMIGVSVPGPLDPWAGVILRSQNIAGWDGYPLRSEIEARTGVPCLLGKDANLAALAEWRLGAGRGTSHMIYITLSTGVGSGVIVDNRLLLGAHGIAGEAGCMIIERNGPLCSCGNHGGCLESLASGPAIARDARQRVEAGEPSCLPELAAGDATAISARMVHDAARAGDGLALDVLRRAGEALGTGLVNLAHLFDPQLFVIGGSVSKAGDLILDPAREVFRTLTLTEAYWRDTPVVEAALGDDVGLVGAACLAWDASAA